MSFNTHLKPAFEILLPSLDNVRIDYWVFGGIGNAAYIGRFIRDNKDIDVFVKEVDFQKTTSTLQEVCLSNGFQIFPIYPLNGDRPKVDIKINGKERFSVTPMYLKNNIVEFRFGRVTDKYPIQILNKVKRNIEGSEFYTSTNEYIKKSFLNHLTARPNKLNRPSIIADINAVFTPEERVELFKLLAK